MTYFYAALSAFAAGVFFRTEDWPRTKRERGWRLALRVALLVAMIVTAYEASALFGPDQTRRDMGIAVAVLWLPQFLVMMIFLKAPEDKK